MLQWIQNNIQLLIPIVFFGVSGLGWFLKKLQEAKEKKQAEEFRKRARLEALRTGRIDGQQQSSQPAASQVQPAAQAETPRQRLEDLARRRQQGQQQRTAAQRTELEEQLRRRREAIDAQRQRQQQRQPSQVRSPAQRPGQRTSQQASQQPMQQPPQRPAQRTAMKPTPQPRRTGERRQVAPLPTMQPVQETVIADVIAAKRAEEARPVEAPLPVAGVGRRSAPITARGIDVRQALIMREILDRPVGMRDPFESGW
ncbi:MAG: hypothetical protein NCW75_01890 [Phycisphaera sp.]|nr:MAG: hypothetical protein NCW75_01890 [Phycisphaera sp.]